MTKKTAVAGVYKTRKQAEEIVKSVQKDSFDMAKLSITLKENIDENNGKICQLVCRT